MHERLASKIALWYGVLGYQTWYGIVTTDCPIVACLEYDEIYGNRIAWWALVVLPHAER
jgi:hypothetical protein